MYSFTALFVPDLACNLFSVELANNDGMDFVLSKKRQSCMIDDAGVRLPIQRAGSLCMLPYRLPTQVETEKTKSKQRTGLIASLITFAAVLAAIAVSTYGIDTSTPALPAGCSPPEFFVQSGYGANTSIPLPQQGTFPEIAKNVFSPNINIELRHGNGRENVNSSSICPPLGFLTALVHVHHLLKALGVKILRYQTPRGSRIQQWSFE
jgi:hypothetical protein